MSNGLKLVSRLRQASLGRWTGSSILPLWNQIRPLLGTLDGSMIASLVFSMNRMYRSAANNEEIKSVRNELFHAITKNQSTTSLTEMSTNDLSKFILAYGFLVREFGSTLDHVRIADSVLTELVTSRDLTVFSAQSLLMVLKGIHMCRVPVSSNLIQFFNSIDIDSLSDIDGKIFLLRAMVDYGLVDYTKFSQTVRCTDTQSVIMTESAAVSLLYSCAMTRFCPAELKAVLLRVATRCNIASTNQKPSLIALWSLEMMGILSQELRESSEFTHVVNAGLASTDSRDVQMAATICGNPHDSTRTFLTQSTKHHKLVSRLECEHGELEWEYTVTPGVVVDAARPMEKLAIEIDGPSHYLVDTRTGERVLNGPSQYKQSKLEELGWCVKRIPV